MRSATVLSALMAGSLSFGTASLHAQSTTIQATANVLSAITVTGTNLAFGNVTPGVTKTVAITDAGAGQFVVTKAAATSVALTFTLPTNLTNGGNNLPIGTWTGGWNNTANNPARRDRLHAERLRDHGALGRRQPVGVGRRHRLAGRGAGRRDLSGQCRDADRLPLGRRVPSSRAEAPVWDGIFVPDRRPCDRPPRETCNAILAVRRCLRQSAHGVPSRRPDHRVRHPESRLRTGDPGHRHARAAERRGEERPVPVRDRNRQPGADPVHACRPG